VRRVAGVHTASGNRRGLLAGRPPAETVDVKTCRPGLRFLGSWPCDNEAFEQQQVGKANPGGAARGKQVTFRLFSFVPFDLCALDHPARGIPAVLATSSVL